ncbi:MAG: extracellular solute-binding protein [Parcubacteria group bacterium]
MLNRKKTIIGVSIGVVVFVIMLIILLGAFPDGSKEKITLEFWGTYDDPDWYDGAIRQFKQDHLESNVADIRYTAIPFEEYEDRLVKAFAAGEGPDIFLMHNTWLPKHFDKIAPMPSEISIQDEPLILYKDFKEQFVDVVINDLTAGEVIYAAPLYVDTLALYYNKDIFNDAGITKAPETWDEFNDAVETLTRRDARGNIVRSAVALGTARNINRSTDILGMLMIQSGARMTNEDNTSAVFANPADGVNAGESALQYYTDFANRKNADKYTWNDLQHYSIDAFIQGEAVMMFNYSHHIETIRDRSVRFNFDIVPVPQFADAKYAVTYANYWAPTVSEQSKHIEEAWQFLNYLMSSEGSVGYINESARPSARRDFIAQQMKDVDLGIFAESALSAVSWYQIDNVKIETIFADMIDDVNLNRKTVRDAIESAQNRVNVYMSR